MATQHIGDTTWQQIPGFTEQNGDDGSLTVTRYYNGAKSGGIGGSGEASWSAFRNAYPTGTSDPEYGSDVRSVAPPSITHSGNVRLVASITFKGADFQGGSNSIPTTTVSQVGRTITVKHPSITFQKFRLTYRAWQTTVSYVRKGAPPEDGTQQGLAATYDVPTDEESIIQEVLEASGEVANMTTSQIESVVEQVTSATLDDLQFTRRGSEDGTPIYDVTETWIKGLKEIDT